MISFSAAATRPAVPVHVDGIRTEKSPRLTALRTLRVMRGSTASVVELRPAIEIRLLSRLLVIFLRATAAHALFGTQYVTVVPAPGSLSNRHQPPASCARSRIATSPRWPGR